MRCGYVVIPKELHGYDSEGNKVSISRLWSRRTSTKFNGASYIVQRGAAALFTMEGMAQTAALISHYLGNASLLLNACRQAGMRVWGGENAPYVWVQCPDGLDSWQMFDKMLHEANVVITPGSGLVPGGKGSSAFPRLIHGKTWMKSAAASTTCLPDRRAFSDRCPGRGAKHRGLCIFSGWVDGRGIVFPAGRGAPVKGHLPFLRIWTGKEQSPFSSDGIPVKGRFYGIFGPCPRSFVRSRLLLMSPWVRMSSFSGRLLFLHVAPACCLLLAPFGGRKGKRSFLLWSRFPVRMPRMGG